MRTVLNNLFGWGPPSGSLGAALDMGGVPVWFGVLLLVGLVALLLLWAAWVFAYGWRRGSIAALCRAAWSAPIWISFFPATATQQLPRTVSLRPVHVLIDDSESMRRPAAGGDLPMARAEELWHGIEADCIRLGCLPKATRLSELDADVKAGYTPLSDALLGWLYKVGAEPWLLISDGADERPTQSWPPALKGVGRGGGAVVAPRGLLIGVQPPPRANLWIKSADVPPFAFSDRPISVHVVLGRSVGEGAPPDEERIQLQVLSGDAPLATANAVFPAGASEASVTTTLQPLAKGQHLLTIRALPTAGETETWDNVVHVPTEVLPNTVGVLHLLGSPSWDGRFLRRYLKGEPKYDLISFFILRDPWDSQQVNERELSLIPFPVERLFRDELPNFRVVVIQNFTLFQFLLPEYQRNLVRFVKDGGGLLFIGGPRALTPADLSSSPLREILPFDYEAGSSAMAGGSFDFGGFDPDMGAGMPAHDDRGPAYDAGLDFQVEMAKPEANKRALANVYEDWESIAESLAAWKPARGLHHMERVSFKADTTTVLLNARTAKSRVPLAVASYPGKGRAIWLFSDAFWRLALTPNDAASRQSYNHFMQGAMTWLMRQDLRQPLVAKNLQLRGGRHEPLRWRVAIQGPAARFYQPSPDWRVTACGSAVQPERLVVSKLAGDEWELSAPLPTHLTGGERCTVEIEGTHAAFGSVKAAVTAVFPPNFHDSEMGAAPRRMVELSELTGASLAYIGNDGKGAGQSAVESVQAWLAAATGQDGVALPNRFKSLRDFYWLLSTPWIWLLLAALPLEVIARRWDQLVATAATRREEA